ncbi:GNAT family N-acetyltransferase [Sulfurovum sp.]|uniref:GNAT family N-acetyltransferase n=1 Tax=Sulfurovum sp. TaxID=1969726 RepID=UPI003568816C
MKVDDVAAVVRVHLASFLGFFLSFLGPRFLSLFYSGICFAPEGIGFVYLNNAGVPAGFVAGTSNPGGFYSRLLKRDWLKFALASIVPVLKKPSVIGRVARAVYHPADNPIGDDVAGLFSLGVLPELQGTSAGKKLVRAFLDEAKKKGCTKVFLTTDRDNNGAVNSFYAKLGFSLERQDVTPEGRRMNEYWISLSGEVL